NPWRSRRGVRSWSVCEAEGKSASICTRCMRVISQNQECSGVIIADWTKATEKSARLVPLAVTNENRGLRMNSPMGWVGCSSDHSDEFLMETAGTYSPFTSRLHHLPVLVLSLAVVKWY